MVYIHYILTYRKILPVGQHDDVTSDRRQARMRTQYNRLKSKPPVIHAAADGNIERLVEPWSEEERKRMQ